MRYEVVSWFLCLHLYYGEFCDVIPVPIILGMLVAISITLRNMEMILISCQSYSHFHPHSVPSNLSFT
jgi:hypothetical protein